ncbi:hypothetical protein JQK15_03840 [Sphingobium sp. BHU LFT2]|uniref:hypothetical protein n=1 Tax=Sphingobium sp. BHU LFT2 TaxID=2807634 RepID=UPI001BEB426C|nr:hypothetical protein [Sphingobium sp. BHU LFT2]MBT2242660.1 hypothetical protein [Sphingobium sp. BHU LFT2]
MADATQARSDDASRNEDLRIERADTPIIAYARLVAQSDEFFDAASKGRGRNSHPAFRILYDTAGKAMETSYLHMLDLLPNGDDRDLMILAGHAAMMANQLVDHMPLGVERDAACKLAKGVASALTAISATLAHQWPAGVDDVEPIFPELAKFIRRDMMIVEARRADAEGC